MYHSLKPNADSVLAFANAACPAQEAGKLAEMASRTCLTYAEQACIPTGAYSVALPTSASTQEVTTVIPSFSLGT
jgi:hypothetical protein